MADSGASISGSRHALSRVLLAALALTATALFLYAFAGRWGEVRAEGIRFQQAYFVLAVLCVTAAVGGFGLVWKGMLASLEGARPRPSFPLLRAFFYSWLARYVPGAVPFLLTRVEMAQRLGYSRAVAFTSLVYENVLLVGTALLVSLVLLFAAMGQHLDRFSFYALALIPLLGAAVLIHPGVLVPAVNRVARLFRRQELALGAVLAAPAMARAILLYGVCVAINGLGFYFVLSALTPVGPEYIPAAIGIYNLAGVMGILAVVFPSGLGVREGISTGLVSLQFPIEVAASAAILARVAAMAADGLPAAAVFAIDAARRWRGQTNA